MKEHKYRVWWNTYKRMEYVSLQNMCNDKEGIYDNRLGKSIALMDFTNLKDKNQNDIYEDDILISRKYENMGLNLTKVYFKDGCYCAWNAPLSCFLEKFEIEVVGNIHQNGDLLDE